MPFFYHQLKNYINRDPLSDWFDTIKPKVNLYQKDKQNALHAIFLPNTSKTMAITPSQAEKYCTMVSVEDWPLRLTGPLAESEVPGPENR